MVVPQHQQRDGLPVSVRGGRRENWDEPQSPPRHAAVCRGDGWPQRCAAEVFGQGACGELGGVGRSHARADDEREDDDARMAVWVH